MQVTAATTQVVVVSDPPDSNNVVVSNKPLAQSPGVLTNAASAKSTEHAEEGNPAQRTTTSVTVQATENTEPQNESFVTNCQTVGANDECSNPIGKEISDPANTVKTVDTNVAPTISCHDKLDSSIKENAKITNSMSKDSGGSNQKINESVVSTDKQLELIPYASTTTNSEVPPVVFESCHPIVSVPPFSVGVSESVVRDGVSTQTFS